MLYFVVIVAVAIAVLLILVLVVPTLTGSGSGTAAAVLTYSGARPVADRTVSGFQGGGWTLLFAAGLVSATTEAIPVNTTALGNTTGCNLTLVANVVSLSLPAYSGNRSSGLAPAWGFVYANSAGTLALVSVINGQGLVIGTLRGGYCALSLTIPPITGNVIDSSQAAAAVQPDARTFLAAHPNASAVYGLGVGVLFGNGSPALDWFVDYSTCSPSTSGVGTGANFNATVNALTGQVLRSNTTSNVSCDSGTPLFHVDGSATLAPLSVPLQERSSGPP